jgi:hypothetical protein
MRLCSRRVSLVLIVALPLHTFRGCYACVEATAMAEADLQSKRRAMLTFVARWAIGVNAEPAK